MRTFGIPAADEGIQRVQPVHETRIHEEVQRPVNGGRCRAAALAAHRVQDIVGPDRLMARPDEFEHAAAARRQSEAAFETETLRILQRLRDAVPMVVILRGEDGIVRMIRCAAHGIDGLVTGAGDRPAAA